MQAFSPRGAVITGTSDFVYCVALVDNVRRGEDGEIAFDYIGETKVNWDGQENVSRMPRSPYGQKFVFVCDEGFEWTEDQLVLSDDLDDNDGDAPWSYVLRVGDRVTVLEATSGDNAFGEEVNFPAGAKGVIESIDVYAKPQGRAITVVVEDEIVNVFDEGDGPFGKFLAPRPVTN